MERLIKCKDCGCEVIAKNNRKQFCDTCLKKRNAESKKISKRRYDKIKGRRYATDSEGNRIPPKPKFVPKNSILDVAKLASQAGMTYGEYVSKYGL